MTYIDFWKSRLVRLIFNPLNYCLGISIAFSFALIFLRMEWSGSTRFLFLVWNLFLAGIPLVASTTLKFFHETNRMRWYVILPTGMLWLLFLPNAPYILTDLFHLRASSSIPIWFDLLLILSFAWNGLIFGLKSVMDVQQIISARGNPFAGWLTAILALIASSFGIYLGRFLRWNSWDILSRPGDLLRDILAPFLDPFTHITPVAMTATFSFFLILVYVTIIQLLRHSPNEVSR